MNKLTPNPELYYARLRDLVHQQRRNARLENRAAALLKERDQFWGERDYWRRESDRLAKEATAANARATRAEEELAEARAMLDKTARALAHCTQRATSLKGGAR